MWYRARMLGGRTNHYGRISLRMGPYDFKPYSRDGKGFDVTLDALPTDGRIVIRLDEPKPDSAG